jgi:sugar phosphate isomerase/epimerase
VILAIEPVYKHIVWNPRRARTVLDEIHSPNLQIIFDPVNLLHPDNLSQREEVIGEAMDLLSDEIAVIHLKDYKLIDGEMQCMACGLGDMDYTQVIRFAKEKKPFIQATLENTKPDNAVQAREYIQTLEREL